MTDAQLMLAACRDLSRIAKSLQYLSSQALANNSAKGLNWETSGTIDEGVEGVMQAEVSNVIGSLSAFNTYWQTHGGNFEKLTTPIV